MSSANFPRVESDGSGGISLTAGVIVCAYTERRWAEIVEGVNELSAQLGVGDQIILVIDHNERLLSRVREEFTSPQVRVLASKGTRGLSGARNTGIEACRQDLALFLDDDAIPQAGWIAAYRARFSESPDVVAVGGAVEPAWEGGSAPRWFPSEFGWVVGCDYRGLPASGLDIRNPIGASMAIRRSSLGIVGHFRDEVGRVGEIPAGDEETELSIRLRAAIPGSRIVRDTGPVVRHYVPRSRQRVRYFARRCYHEGRSKAAMTALVGTRAGLSSERTYVIKTLVRGIGIHVAQAVRGDLWGLPRAAMLPVGLACVTFGYVSGKLRLGFASVRS